MMSKNRLYCIVHTGHLSTPTPLYILKGSVGLLRRVKVGSFIEISLKNIENIQAM